MNLTTQELADRWRMSAGTLSNWRASGRGPRFFRIGSKVLYRLIDIEAWERKAQEGVCAT